MMLIIWFQVILVRAVGSEDYICMQCMDLIFTIPLFILKLMSGEL